METASRAKLAAGFLAWKVSIQHLPFFPPPQYSYSKIHLKQTSKMWNQTENTYGHKLRVAVNGLRTAFPFMAKFYLICFGGSLLQLQKYN